MPSRTSKLKEHQTTLRFTTEMWQELVDAAAELDVSVARYVRDAARARLDEESERQRASHRVREDAANAQDDSLSQAESSAALWEQGRLARQRAQMLREEAEAKRGLGRTPRRPVTVPDPLVRPWQGSRLARERETLAEERSPSGRRPG